MCIIIKHILHSHLSTFPYVGNQHKHQIYLNGEISFVEAEKYLSHESRQWSSIRWSKRLGVCVRGNLFRTPRKIGGKIERDPYKNAYAVPGLA